MARDQVELMQQRGYARFSVAGHDCGGRCAYRLALDHPERSMAEEAHEETYAALYEFFGS